MKKKHINYPKITNYIKLTLYTNSNKNNMPVLTMQVYKYCIELPLKTLTPEKQQSTNN